MLVGLVGALVLAAGFSFSATGAVVTRAGSVTNNHGSNAVAQVVWSESYDPITDVGHYGGLYGDVEEWGTILGLWEVDDQAITCADGSAGKSSTWTNGDGPGQVTIAPDLSRAAVSGVLTITTSTYDSCTDTYQTVATITGVTMRLELVATTRLSKDLWKFHDLVPGEYNFKSTARTKSRDATGTALLGGEPYDYDAGLISSNSWREHTGSH